MPADRQHPDDADDPAVDRWATVMIWATPMVIMGLLDGLTWLTARGGVFSVVTAALAVSASPRAVDVDQKGLWVPSVVLLSLATAAVCRLANRRVTLTNRRTSLVYFLLVMGGGLLLSVTVGQRTVTRFMADHGYSRCVGGDHVQGKGKGRVWFVNYTRRPEDCRRSGGG